ncbi:DUF4382 domain-containing protein [Aliikangiella sp. IMCC44632]
MNNIKTFVQTLLMALIVAGLSACGGTSVEELDPILDDAQSVSCITSDSPTPPPGCGTLFVGVTDADGDFLTYNVAISGIELTRLDGTQVSIMPNPEMVNFVDYVELSELAAAATIPTGVYTQVVMTVDYSNADIAVEKNAEPVEALMLDEQGDPLTTQALTLQLDSSNLLIVGRNRPALLELDFNLAASHHIDLETTPVSITTEPYLTAEIDPVESKEFRIRGPLISVAQADNAFRIALRPFHRRDGRRGGVNVSINDTTNFEINNQIFVGEAGLEAMQNLAVGTPTMTFGVFNRLENRFTALNVMAGTSVPGADKDAAKGVIVARDGNRLRVKGATLIRQDSEVTFGDEIDVVISDATRVFKSRQLDDAVNSQSLSVGQAITVLGEMQTTEDGIVLDASQGAVKMRMTFASGHALERDNAWLNIDLQALQGRLPETYDFSGTGIDASFDADPQNYEVSIDNLVMSSVAAGDPIRVSGFVSDFGSAPADFKAYNVINYANSRSQVFVNWPDATQEPAFSEISPQSLTINIPVDVDGGVYKLIQGGIRTDLTTLSAAVSIQPLAERGIYSIRTGDSIMVFSNFADFVTELQAKLNASYRIDLMHAVGGFSRQTHQLSTLKLHVKLTTN